MSGTIAAQGADGALTVIAQFEHHSLADSDTATAHNAPHVLRLDDASVIVVTEEGEQVLGGINGNTYVGARWPDIDAMLVALRADGWHHVSIDEEMVVLHHCGTNRFEVLASWDKRFAAEPLIRMVIDAGGILTPAPAL